MDPDKALQNDVNKLKNVTTERRNYSPGEIIQGALFSISICFLIGMVASMPWVGPDKMISGQMWLGVSLFGIVGFGLLGMLVRFVESSTASAYDRELDRRLGGR